MSQPLRPSDPAYWMLEQGLRDPSKRTRTTVYRAQCYICRDPEFSLMGLPLCYPCWACGGHVAADDTHCDGCGGDQQLMTWCYHLADSDRPADNLELEPCRACGRYFVNDDAEG